LWYQLHKLNSVLRYFSILLFGRATTLFGNYRFFFTSEIFKRKNVKSLLKSTFENNICLTKSNRSRRATLIRNLFRQNHKNKKFGSSENRQRLAYVTLLRLIGGSDNGKMQINQYYLELELSDTPNPITVWSVTKLSIIANIRRHPTWIKSFSLGLRSFSPHLIQRCYTNISLQSIDLTNPVCLTDVTCALIF